MELARACEDAASNWLAAGAHTGRSTHGQQEPHRMGHGRTAQPASSRCTPPYHAPTHSHPRPAAGSRTADLRYQLRVYAI
jgi:hypothetical protein